MPRNGYIRLSRGALQHPFFKRKAYSEFEAWVYLLNDAAWKPRQRRVSDYLADLARGQLVTSIRHLSREWSWSKSKVERFLARLKTETMIEAQSPAGITIITICNYEKYQGWTGSDESDDTDDSETDAGQDRDTSETPPRQMRDNTEEIKHSIIEEGNPSISSGQVALFAGEQVVGTKPPVARKARTKVQYTAEFELFWGAYPRKEDKPTAFKAFDRALREQRASFEVILGGAQSYADQRKNEDPKYTKHPSTWLNADAWNNQPIRSGPQLTSAGTGILDAMQRKGYT